MKHELLFRANYMQSIERLLVLVEHYITTVEVSLLLKTLKL